MSAARWVLVALALCVAATAIIQGTHLGGDE